MAKLTLDDLANLENETTATSTINANNALIEAALENTLSRDGTTPNQMDANLDMNSRRILNLPAPVSSGEPLRLADIDPDNINTQVAEAEAARNAALGYRDEAEGFKDSAQTAQTAAEAAQTAAEAAADKLQGTSTTSRTIGTGSLSFVTQADKFFSAGTWVNIVSAADPATNNMSGQVTSYSGTNLAVDITKTEGSGTYTDWIIYVSGAVGVQGETGSTGSTGATGDAGADGVTVINGLDYDWDTGTADADPGSGRVRGNNASLALITNLYINKTGNNSEDFEAYIGSWDDSTTTANRGTIRINTVADLTEYVLANVSGSLTDATTYWKVPVTVVSSNGTPSNNDRMAVAFFRTGDAGAGTGDVVGPASSTDNGYVRFDGTTGKLIKDGAATVPVSDLNITGATAATDGAVADELAIYDASATANRKMTIGNALKAINGLTAETSPAVGDELALYDISASTTDKITLQNMLKVINALTADATPDTAADYVVTYDASASDVKKVLLSSIGGSGGGGLIREPQIFTYTGSPQTWTKPTGCTYIITYSVGGGGGGGGSGSTNNRVGGGGSGAGGCLDYIDVTSISSETVTIGAGGAGGTSTTAGSNGTATTFGAHSSANAGQAGGLGSDSGFFATPGTATGATFNLSGGAGSSGGGTTAGAYNSGTGGYPPFGLGIGGPSGLNKAGDPGTGYGAGGGGGHRTTGSSQAGGNGADGICIVWEYE